MPSGPQDANLIFPSGVDTFYTKVDRNVIISGEAHTVPASAPYEFFLGHAPQSGTLSIPGYTEVSGTPLTNQFQPVYSGANAGLMTFNGINASDSVTATYTAYGDVVKSDFFNDLQSGVTSIEQHILSGLGISGNYLPLLGGIVSGNITMNGANVVSAVASGNQIGTNTTPFGEIHSVSIFGDAVSNEEETNVLTLTDGSYAVVSGTSGISVIGGIITGSSINEIDLTSQLSNITLNSPNGNVVLNGLSVSTNASISPAISGVYNLGSASAAWLTIYADNIVSTGLSDQFVSRSGDSMTGDLSMSGSSIKTNSIVDNSGNMSINSSNGLSLVGNTVSLDSANDISLNVSVSNSVNITDTASFGPAGITTETTISPTSSGTDNIGSISNPYGSVYADNFVGMNLDGSFVRLTGDTMTGNLLVGNVATTGSQPYVSAENIKSLGGGSGTINFTASELNFDATSNIHFDLGPSGTQKLQIGLSDTYFTNNFIPTASGTYDIGSTGLYVDNVYANNITSTTLSSGVTIPGATISGATISGTTAIASGGSIVPDVSGASTIGSTGNPISTLYVDTIVTSVGTGTYVAKAGDTMTGDLTLSTANILNTTSGANNIGTAALPFGTIYADNIQSSGMSDQFVNVTGDSMTGALTIDNIQSTGNLTVSGVGTITTYGNQIADEAEQINLTSTVGPIIANGNTEIQLLSNSVAKAVVNISGVEFYSDIYPDTSGSNNVGTAARPWGAIYADSFVGTAASGTGNYVLKIGDSMSGDLLMQGGASLTTDSTSSSIGGTGSYFGNLYVNEVFQSGSSINDIFVNATGDTMTGDLYLSGTRAVSGIWGDLTVESSMPNYDLNLNSVSGINMLAAQGKIDITSSSANGGFTLNSTNIDLIAGGAGRVALQGGSDGVYISGNSGDIRVIASNADTLTLEGGDIIVESTSTNDISLRVSTNPLSYIEHIGNTLISGNVHSAASGSYTFGTASSPFSGVYFQNINGQTATDQIYNEVPSGTINGINTSFSTFYTPVSGTDRLFRAGMRMSPNGIDYTMVGSAITFVTAPSSGDNLLIDYEKSIF